MLEADDISHDPACYGIRETVTLPIVRLGDEWHVTIVIQKVIRSGF